MIASGKKETFQIKHSRRKYNSFGQLHFLDKQTTQAAMSVENEFDDRNMLVERDSSFRKTVHSSLMKPTRETSNKSLATTRLHILGDRLKELSNNISLTRYTLVTSRTPSLEVDDFYLHKLIKEKREGPAVLSSDLGSQPRLMKKKGMSCLLEKSHRDFESNVKRISEDLFLNFPTDVREYFEGQNSKTRQSLRDLLIGFEKDVFDFNEITSYILGYKVLASQPA